MPTPTLILIDVQKGFDDASWGRRSNPGAEKAIVSLLAICRALGIPIVHVKHMSSDMKSPLRPGQPGNDFKDEVNPLEGEVVIEKTVNSCFIGTRLEEYLRERGCDTVILAGFTTNHCVSTTARMAGNLGFRTLVISDATAAFERKGVDGTLFSPDLVHAVALSDLHGEFATVTTSSKLTQSLRLGI